MVQKLKEKAIKDAEKRVKKFEKMTHKSVKKAEKDYKEEEKQRKKHTLIVSIVFVERLLRQISVSETLFSSLQTDSLTSANCRVVLPPTTGTPMGQSQKFSEIVSTINGNSKKGFGAVSKKILNKKPGIGTINESAKILDPTKLGKLSIRSKTDNDVIYAAPSNLMYGQENQRMHMKDVFEAPLAGTASRTSSESTSHHGMPDSGVGESLNVPPRRIFMTHTVFTIFVSQNRFPSHFLRITRLDDTSR